MSRPWRGQDGELWKKLVQGVARWSDGGQAKWDIRAVTRVEVADLCCADLFQAHLSLLSSVSLDMLLQYN